PDRPRQVKKPRPPDRDSHTDREHSPEYRLSLRGAPHGATKRLRLGCRSLPRCSGCCRPPAVANSCLVAAEERENNVVVQSIPRQEPFCLCKGAPHPPCRLGGTR